MKVHVTKTQYEQLTPHARNKFIAWTRTRTDPPVYYLSLDRLIAFIDEHVGEGWWHIEREGGRKGWRVQAKHMAFSEDDKPELIDALWDAVKVFLEEGEQP